MLPASWRRSRLLLRGSRYALTGSLLTIFLSLTVLILYFESMSANPGFKTFGDAIWWAIVTATTTGYGDRVPVTGTGKVLAVGTIVLGIVIMSLFTGTIASVLVERRILRGLGMEKSKLSRHLIVCGYNLRLPRLIHAIRKTLGENVPVLIINQAEEEKMIEIVSQIRDPDLHYLRGDYVHEDVLEKGNIDQASAALILSDLTSPERTDERTILAALALRAANPSIRILAEIQREENIPHLQRARVDEIVCGDAYTPFIMASGIRSSGIPLALESLLQPEDSKALRLNRIPGSLIGKTFRDVFNYFREKDTSLAIGLASEAAKGISLSDILSADSSAIDQFITRKLGRSDLDILSQRPQTRVEIAPADDRRIDGQDMVILLGGK